ncbi:hypothetical protein FNB15_11950 [Ferrovibrio terrae]|uniref:Uncharacterized protein n=1 Tax=Ferrovibrio terrae TaxID=2594003 RepID=A0A516H2G9_9PROT|nr:hypothetical protein [Ferrovibrio terrae]QDO97935.1 hypothetical protein FNB15_11950 [Ferrovibrio terrae]
MTDHKTQLEKDGKSPRPQDAHLHERRDDQSRRAKAEQAQNSRNAGQTGNIRQNTHNQGYQQDR